jgi:cadmium resistance protein CadD (predicted permease)
LHLHQAAELRNSDDDGDDENTAVVDRLSKSRWRTYLPFLMVATITFSGGEEIGIYTSIFITYNSLSEIVTIIMVVMVLTGVWCRIAIYLVNHSLLAAHFRQISNWALPFVLIVLGLYILTEAFLVPSLNL